MLLVSILIPVYNAESYIAETIKSALNQTYKNIEVIVVDDGSTDKSLSIAKQFESNRIKVFSQTNLGASTARNTAFIESSGDLIQYLDADDLLHPDKIKSQVDEFLKLDNPNVILSGKWGRFENSIDNVYWENQPINKDYDRTIKWLVDSWNGLGMAQPGIWLTPRHIIDKAGPWHESLSLNDDGEFFCRVLLKANQIIYVPNSKVYYRSNITTSLSQAKTLKALRSELDTYILYCKHILLYKDSIELRKALGNNFLNFAYQHYNSSKPLSEMALSEFKKLSTGKAWPIGGKTFKTIAQLLGFTNALKLKQILNF